MNIIIDGDSCPIKVRALIFNRSKKASIITYFITNRKIKHIAKGNEHINFVEVEIKKDSADDYIKNIFSKGDLLISNDLLLLNEIIKKFDATVLNMHGDVFDKDNIEARLTKRELNLDNYKNSKRDYQDQTKFANTFNDFLQKNKAK